MSNIVSESFPKQFPKQHQNKQPGIEDMMQPAPVYDHPNYNKPSLRLQDKVAVITGGDSGIGRAVAIAYAKEGADVAIVFYDEHQDAEITKQKVEAAGRKCLLINGDVSDENFCYEAINKVITEFGKVDILVNNAAQQYPQNSIEDITKEQLEHTFKNNVFSAFYMTKAVMPHFKPRCNIINTTSITAYKGDELLIDYSATKGALVSFTRSMAASLASRNIRVNAVAPGPIWTPLITSSFDESKVEKFGSDTPMGRAGQPVELAQAYVFLASEDASFITGQAIHINGGKIVSS